MPQGKFAIFTMRNGENRIYRDVTRVDAARPHLVLVYRGKELIAELDKRSVVSYALHDDLSVPAAAATEAEAAPADA